MMGQQSRKESLFYYFRLEDQIPETHLLRLIDRYVDFSFVRDRLKRFYPGLDAADYLAWVGGHYPGYYYDRAAALNRAEFWRLHDTDLKRAVDLITSQTTEDFPELKRLARKWGFRLHEV